MTQPENLLTILIQTASEMDSDLAEEISNHGSTTVLFGENGHLDSLELVELIVMLEEAIQDQYGIAVVLADEKAMSSDNSPFRTVGALTEHLATRLEGHS